MLYSIGVKFLCQIAIQILISGLLSRWEGDNLQTAAGPQTTYWVHQVKPWIYDLPWIPLTPSSCHSVKLKYLLPKADFPGHFI